MPTTLEVNVQNLISIAQSKNLVIYSQGIGKNKAKLYIQAEPSIVLSSEIDTTTDLFNTIKPKLNNINPNLRDSTGKQIIMFTPRPPGTAVYITGESDDTTDITKVGGGAKFTVKHSNGGDQIQHYYWDFNVIENETWIYDGAVNYQNCINDYIILEVVPRVVSISNATSTNYNLYNNYLIIPAAGNGTIQINSDITKPHGGLVQKPKDNSPGLWFWDADWDTENKVFTNIRPAPNGDGKFNMFAVEVALFRFVNNIPLYGNNTYTLNSTDADKIGQGMRLKLTTVTNVNEGDRDWKASCFLNMYRARSV